MQTIFDTPRLSRHNPPRRGVGLSALVPKGVKNELWMGLAARLKETRERAGLSARDLSRRAGLSESVVHFLEGGTAPNIDTIERIAAVLGVPPAWFAYGPEGHHAFKPRRPRQPLPPEPPSFDPTLGTYRSRSAGVGLRISQARMECALSMRTLSTAAGISNVAWSKTEAGRSVPRVDTLERMAVSLDVAPGWLAYGDEVQPH